MPFRTSAKWVCLCAALVCLISRYCPAQDLRVTTSVVDRSQADKPRVLSRSLTLFHAGMAYDYMVDLGEVVVFEPQRHCFVVLNRDYTATEVSFSEVNRFLGVASAESESYLEQLRKDPSPEALRAAHAVRFQFHPQFREQYRPESSGGGVLTMTGDPLTYQVRTDKSRAPQSVQQYLEYADWTSRLNYVLHPHATFPAPRLLLNEALRKCDQLPTQVELTMQGDKPVRLQAEHAYAWELTDTDRNSLSQWEKQLKSKELKWMTFTEYQQHVLNAKGEKTARR